MSKSMKIPNPLLFIIGTQRAGTTLLTRVLSAHKDLFIQNEISVESVFPNSKNAEEVLVAMEQQIVNRHQSDIDQLLKAQHKKYWGVKDPELTEHLNSVEMFANVSKFIILIRDGRGVVNSYMENKWGLGTNAYTGAMRWMNEVNDQVAFANKYPKQSLLIRFEDLVEDMPSTLTRISEHLDIEFDPNMLKYDKKQAQFKQNAQNVNTNSAPNIALAEKWKSALSQREISYINFVAGKTLREHGYELAVKPINPNVFMRIYYRLHQRIIGEMQLQWQWRKAKARTKQVNG